MTKELSSLDIHFLLMEFKGLVNAKIDKIYQEKEHIMIQLHVPNIGKKFIHVLFPSLMCLSDRKISLKSGRFALSLRKHVSGCRIRKIRQLGFERIVEFTLEGKEKSLNLIIELFRPGNMILCDYQYDIIIAKEYKGFGSRVIRPRIKYDYPKKEYNFLDINKNQFVDLLKNSKKKSVVISLATELGLGGVYAEEICSIAGIDKALKELSVMHINKLFKAIEGVRNKKLDPQICDDKKVVPFKLTTCSNNKKTDSFSEALFDYFVAAEKKQDDSEKKKLMDIIEKQKSMIAELEKSIAENKKKGELIYENYSMLAKIFDEIRNMSKEDSKAKFSYNKKDNMILIDL